MPIYEYQCKNCGHELEAIQKMSDSPLTECPECKQHELKKLISASKFVLKGQGWYETDFKQKKPQAVDKKEEAKTSSTETKTDKPAETKKETKSEASKTVEKTTKSTPSSENKNT